MHGHCFFIKLPKLFLSHASRSICAFNGDRNFARKELLANCSVFLNLRKNDVIIACQLRFKSVKARLDYSKVPKLDEKDLTEQFVRGNGPGGQAVAKTNNAVVLKHKPSGIVVKCHETRSMWDNKKRAREILIRKLDNMINGKDSIENQERLLLEQKSLKMSQKKKKMSALKAAFKEREGLD